jgi:alpha-1,6-mannosyltransferase
VTRALRTATLAHPETPAVATGVTSAPGFDLARAPLPPVRRPDAELAVLDVTEFYGETSGGVRTYLHRKAAYVAARPALRQAVVVPGARDALADADGVRWYRLAGPRVPMQSPYRFMLATRQPRRIVEHERPHVVEVGSPGLVPWILRLATRRTRTPLVHFYHSDYPRLLAGPPGSAAWRRRAGALAWRYARQVDRLFRVTIVASDFAARELHDAGIDRVARVPLGADLARFHPARRARARTTRAAHGLPHDAPLALYVGRLAEEKELDVLLRAWPAVRRRTGAELALAGEGPDAARLRALDSGGARWLGFEPDADRLADLIAAADLLVAPGPFETFGLAIVEGMACGVPVLANAHGAGGELVARAGAGATFPRGDAGALAEEACALLGGPASWLHALGAAGRAHAEREHAWDAVFDRLFALHRAVRDGAWGEA